MDRFSDKYASLLKYTSDDVYTCRPTMDAGRTRN